MSPDLFEEFRVGMESGHVEVPELIDRLRSVVSGIKDVDDLDRREFLELASAVEGMTHTITRLNRAINAAFKYDGSDMRTLVSNPTFTITNVTIQGAKDQDDKT